MKNKTEPINIVLASDQTYYIGPWVTLVSLLSNTNTKSDITTTNEFNYQTLINYY